MPRNPLQGSWAIESITMNMREQGFAFGQNPKGFILIEEGGAIAEGIEAEFNDNPFQWFSKGTYRVEHRQGIDLLIMRVAEHSHSGYIGKEITRAFAFAPGSNDDSLALHLPSEAGTMSLLLSRVQ